MALGLGLGLPYSIQNFGLKVPKNLRITSTTATTISYAWDASAGVDGYQFGIYEDSACTILIETITIYGASTTTYTWDMTYFQLATNYFSRVYTNFAETVGSTDRTNWYVKFKYLVGVGANSHIDMMSGASFTCCTSAYQARTSLFGNYQSTPSGGWTNANWSNGVGWTQDGSGGYLSWDYNPYYGTYYTLNNAGYYQKLNNYTYGGGVQAFGGNSEVADGVLLLFAGTIVPQINNLQAVSIVVITTFSTINLKRLTSNSVTLKLDTTTYSTAYASTSIFNDTIYEGGAKIIGGPYSLQSSILKGFAMGDSTMDSATLFLD